MDDKMDRVFGKETFQKEFRKRRIDRAESNSRPTFDWRNVTQSCKRAYGLGLS